MRQVEHKIEVNSDADEAFAMCLNVAEWPNIFPPCLDAEVLAENEREQTIRLMAKANKAVFQWQSSRQVDRVARRIEFQQAKPSPLVKFMRGSWQINSSPQGCEILLLHCYEIKDEVKGLVDGVESLQDAERFMQTTIDDNSHRELQAISNTLNRRFWRHEFSESMLIDRPKTAIYQLLKDAGQWSWLLPHCSRVDMLYDDPCYQEFQMTVQVAGNSETIRSIRYLQDDRISYFQPTPPPALREHHGYWQLQQTASGVEVTSWHGVVLNPDYWRHRDVVSAKKQVEEAINRNSLGTMHAIAEKLGLK